MSVRPAELRDVVEIHAMVRELADYEHELDKVEATVEDFQTALFGEDPQLFALVAEQDGATVGVALWFVSFSTWTGKHGLYLEDLYVRPGTRGQGHGKALLIELARICVQRRYGRMDWAVLDWNQPAIDFYTSIGAVSQDDWTGNRLAGAALAALAATGLDPG